MSVAGADGNSQYPAFASATVLAVYERLLEEILSGQRTAGDPVRDRDIAIEFAVSRTPVREAIQMLRHLGIIEASASRYTRIAQFGPRDIVQSWRLFLMLYGEVVHELAETGRALPMAAMERSYRSAASALRRGDLRTFWPRVFEIHDHLVRRTSNPHLLRALRTVAYALRVAVVTNRELLDPSRVLRANREALDALAAQDDGYWERSIASFAEVGAALSPDGATAS